MTQCWSEIYADDHHTVQVIYNIICKLAELTLAQQPCPSPPPIRSIITHLFISLQSALQVSEYAVSLAATVGHKMQQSLLLAPIKLWTLFYRCMHFTNPYYKMLWRQRRRRSLVITKWWWMVMVARLFVLFFFGPPTMSSRINGPHLWLRIAKDLSLFANLYRL